MRILFIGDVVGDRGVDMIETYLPQLKRDLKPQATIVNGENSTPVGRGISQSIYKRLLSSGADVVTMGNHTWDNREIFDFIDDTKKLVRPANFPGKDVPGRGWTKLKVNQATLAVINLQGRVFLPPLDDPFAVADELVQEIRKETPIIFVDMHAEATSEKRAIAMHLSGQVSAVVGTHTHVQTSDGQILNQETAFLTDAGMTGPASGILGMQPEGVISRFLNQRPTRYEVETSEPGILSGCVIDINDQTGHATKIKNVLIDAQHPYDY
ncbi:TIGR00282 family metallophosphoesterase [Secundilactobacillus similis]|uniref:Calcineurin-like phosphoesterase n=1 Tax=Secundilactobacillus similis DSM 23365 = JCM 2765 TaxID=1423804 RepID=A0A0R2FK17_9LACO|nr:TIGR00282 family metallophosphoesterase [Secundilactobacillus similis]KRN24749.1 calcineurin-like phosphoesterase [Secundilactobacillus similis DSM 23365 = JCM 2765]